jgi:hypothetical protein
MDDLIKYPLPCKCAGPKFVSMCAMHQAEQIDRDRASKGISFKEWADDPRTNAIVSLEVGRLKTIGDLSFALNCAVILMSSYAELLNAHDGGLRLIFKTPEEWMKRLKERGL